MEACLISHQLPIKYDEKCLYYVGDHRVSYTAGFSGGVRIVISLKAENVLAQASGDGSVDNPWKLAQ